MKPEDPIARWLALSSQQKAAMLKDAMPQPAWAVLRARMVNMREEDMTPIQRDAIIYIMERESP